MRDEWGSGQTHRRRFDADGFSVDEERSHGSYQRELQQLRNRADEAEAANEYLPYLAGAVILLLAILTIILFY